MKKLSITALIFIVSFTVCLIVSCKPNIDDGQTREVAGINEGENDNSLKNEPVSSEIDEFDSQAYDEYMDYIVDDAIGGGGIGGLYERYIGYVSFISGEFGEVTDRYLQDDCFREFEKEFKYIENDYAYFRQNMPPLLYYLVQKMGVTREQIEKYNEARGVTKISKELIDGLFVKDVKEAMQLYKNPCAFYADGNVYNIYDLMRLSDQIDSLNITDDEFIKTSDLIIEYIKNVNEQSEFPVYDDSYVEFLEKCVADRK